MQIQLSPSKILWMLSESPNAHLESEISFKTKVSLSTIQNKPFKIQNKPPYIPNAPSKIQYTASQTFRCQHRLQKNHTSWKK